MILSEIQNSLEKVLKVLIRILLPRGWEKFALWEISG